MDIYPSSSRDSASTTSDSGRNILTATLAEFVGTFMFLLLALSATQVSNLTWSHSFQDPNLTALIFTSLAFAASFTANLWVFYRVSAACFNPVVTFALVCVGAISFVRAVPVFIAQLLAAMSAAAVVSALFPGPLVVSTRLGGGTSITQGLFIEMFLTAQLVIAVLMLSVIKHKATYIAPLGIGTALFVAHLSGLYFSGASLNPARSFGPDVAIRSFPGYHWIYWVGPGLGAILAVALFCILRALKFETCNPGQTDDGRDDSSIFTQSR